VYDGRRGSGTHTLGLLWAKSDHANREINGSAQGDGADDLHEYNGEGWRRVVALPKVDVIGKPRDGSTRVDGH